MKDYAKKEKRSPKPPPKDKRLPPGKRLPQWVPLPTRPPISPTLVWQKPEVAEVTHLNSHGMLALLLAHLLVHPPTAPEVQDIAITVTYYASIDQVWMVDETAPPLSKEVMALFPFTDITRHEHQYCNEFWRLLRWRAKGRKKISDIIRRADWLRWLAARDAHALMSADGRTMSWDDARAAASLRLAGTAVEGSAPTMKRSYDRIQRILRTVGYSQ